MTRVASIFRWSRVPIMGICISGFPWKTVPAFRSCHGSSFGNQDCSNPKSSRIFLSAVAIDLSDRQDTLPCDLPYQVFLACRDRFFCNQGSQYIPRSSRSCPFCGQEPFRNRDRLLHFLADRLLAISLRSRRTVSWKACYR